MRNGKARLSRLLFAALALGAAAAPLAAQRADRRTGSATAQSATAWTPFIAGSVALAALPEPFASNCLDDDGGGGAGVQASIGVRSAGGWDFQARYTGMREVQVLEPDCAAAPRAEPDGVHRHRTYEDELWGDGIRTLDVQAGFTPPPLPFLRIAAGAGVEADRGLPFLLGSAGLRLGSRVQFVAGADVLLFRTPYVILEEEWQDFRIVRSSQVGEGETWRRGWVFHLGAELPIRLR